MFKKIILILACLVGALLGGFGAWILHFIIDVNVPFITSHTVLIGFVGTLGLLFFANAVYNIKADHPRAYGLLVLGVACGIFLQAVIYLKNPCPDDCTTDFDLKLGACAILMVDGLTAFYRRAVEPSPKKSAD